MTDPFIRARDWLSRAGGLLITAGAGMGIDSGLPDFRGPGGFWAVYPALAKARMDFIRIANPAAFASNPELAWGFYGHRLQLYRNTMPHAGFARLLAMGRQLPHGLRVFTSNVDGQFQKAGFSATSICEVHGSIHHLQCIDNCRGGIWPADDFQPLVDAEHCRLLNDAPRCPHCGGLARPNILMFGDSDWEERRTALQYRRLTEWLAGTERLLCIEIGAGSAIPTVRRFSEHYGWRLIRINPHEAQVPDPQTGIGLPLGSLAWLEQLGQALAAG